MRETVKLYFKLARGGFFNQSYLFLMLMVTGFLIVGPKTGVDMAGVIFAFLAMGIFSDLDEKKYTLTSSLPIKLKLRIKMQYVNTYVVCLLGLLGVQISYFIRGEFRFITALCIIMIPGIIGCHLYYMIFASNQFKKDPQEQTGNLLAYTLILTMLGMILFLGGLFINGGIFGSLIIKFSPLVQIVVSGILIALTVFINKISYQMMCQKTFISDEK